MAKTFFPTQPVEGQTPSEQDFYLKTLIEGQVTHTLYTAVHR
jgi:hypothetical protein